VKRVVRASTHASVAGGGTRWSRAMRAAARPGWAVSLSVAAGTGSRAQWFVRPRVRLGLQGKVGRVQGGEGSWRGIVVRSGGAVREGVDSRAWRATV
jgi:hypothetical protein